MAGYRIFADAAGDIPESTLRAWGVSMIDMTFRFTDEDAEQYNSKVDVHEFYEQMRAGRCSRTAAINMATFLEAFRPTLAEGTDILYVAFSSGGSTTYEQSLAAIEVLKSEFPERKILSVDALAYSAGLGLTVYLAAKKQQEGASIEEVYQYVEDIRLHVCHWFTVDDLVYLKRGGRVSAATALVGTMLGIKPVLHVDDEGHLVNVDKARSRRRSLKAMADRYKETALDPEHGPVFIGHGDCIEDAELLRGMIKELSGGKDIDLMTYIGPVIGSHSGPGTVALFFLGSKR
jgi:DegV family protein with EDD domain